MTETDLSTWLLGMEAAMRIGCSTRTIERLAAAFVVEAGQAAANGNGQGFTYPNRSPGRDLDKLRTGAHDPIGRFFAFALQALQSPPSPPVSEMAETLYVTIAQASAITGLTQAYLRRAIGNLTLPAIRDRGWRIRRKDLEAL